MKAATPVTNTGTNPAEDIDARGAMAARMPTCARVRLGQRLRSALRGHTETDRSSAGETSRVRSRTAT